jgi:hypothetical protein
VSAFDGRLPSAGLVIVAALAASGLPGCVGAVEADSVAGAPVPASGTIRGTAVVLSHAEFDGDLALHAGGGWGFGPSLLIFLFLGDGEIPAGRTFAFEVGEEVEARRPQVHYRWRGSTGDVESAAATGGYALKLAFGAVENGTLAGSIEFSVPGEDTRVAGGFTARIVE